MYNPIILSTWSFGQRANRAGWPILEMGGASIDAVEAACKDAEADPGNHTVGYSGYPDASGRPSVDAAIMLSPRRFGSVALVRNFIHPISIARRVMEKTQHVLLAGDGAEAFAHEQGFAPAVLLTDEMRAAWEKWRADQMASTKPVRNVEEFGLGKADRAVTNLGEENHDTIGVLALDSKGVLAGGCTTSGMPFKLPGRVGDSPIIGQGLYVDPKAGAAVATGHGELVMGVCGSFLAVELMRAGKSPLAAATHAILRIADCYELGKEDQVGIITLAPDGSWSSASVFPGFRVAARDCARDQMVDPGFVLTK